MYMYFQCVYNLHTCAYNYLYNEEILLSHKKEWSFAFFTAMWMDKSDKEWQMIPLTSGTKKVQ